MCSAVKYFVSALREGREGMNEPGSDMGWIKFWQSFSD